MSKLCRFEPLEFDVDAMGAPAQPEPFVGQIEGETVYELLGDPLTETRRGERSWRRDHVRLLAPVLPSKIVCVGRNYKAHAAEFGNDVPSEPIIFLKPPTSIIGPGERIVLTPLSKRIDHEAELAVVIGRKCHRLAEADDVTPYILGYMCLNDVSARDLQKADVQWTRAKSFDTFCPMGPVIETELNLSKATIAGFVNGERRQYAPASDMIFPVDFLVRWISQVMTLLPGDVIATGTPSGVGPLKDGDIVEITIDGIGTLRNPVAGQVGGERLGGRVGLVTAG